MVRVISEYVVLGEKAVACVAASVLSVEINKICVL